MYQSDPSEQPFTIWSYQNTVLSALQFFTTVNYLVSKYFIKNNINNAKEFLNSREPKQEPTGGMKHGSKKINSAKARRESQKPPTRLSFKEYLKSSIKRVSTKKPHKVWQFDIKRRKKEMIPRIRLAFFGF